MCVSHAAFIKRDRSDKKPSVYLQPQSYIDNPRTAQVIRPGLRQESFNDFTGE